MTNIPNPIRQSLDEAYSVIRTKSAAQKKKQHWKRSIVAVVAIALAVMAVSNESVQASFSQLFGQDRGVEKAIEHGYVQTGEETAEDHGITITLSNHFYDARKLGLILNLAFNDSKQLDGIEYVSMDYRIKNGDGTYLLQMIPDTKPLKGEGEMYFSGGREEVFINHDADTVKIESLFEDMNEHTLPKISGAILEVETVKLWNEEGAFESIDGEWNISLQDMNLKDEIEPIHYKAVKESMPIQHAEATAYPTSFFLEFTVDGNYSEREHQFSEMLIIDAEGNEYRSDLYNQYSDDEYETTTMNASFQISAYDEIDSFTFYLGEIAEIEFSK